jgi:hypothetical protein
VARSSKQSNRFDFLEEQQMTAANERACANAAWYDESIYGYNTGFSANGYHSNFSNAGNGGFSNDMHHRDSFLVTTENTSVGYGSPLGSPLHSCSTVPDDNDLDEIEVKSNEEGGSGTVSGTTSGVTTPGSSTADDAVGVSTDVIDPSTDVDTVVVGRADAGKSDTGKNTKAAAKAMAKSSKSEAKSTPKKPDENITSTSSTTITSTTTLSPTTSSACPESTTENTENETESSWIGKPDGEGKSEGDSQNGNGGINDGINNGNNDGANDGNNDITNDDVSISSDTNLDEAFNQRILSLGACLTHAASRGVKIYILMYNEYRIANLGLHTQTMYERLKWYAGKHWNKNFFVLMHPFRDSAARGVTREVLFTFHEKLLIVDRRVSFIGGIDLAYGR